MPPPPLTSRAQATQHWCVEPDPQPMRHLHPRDLRMHPIRRLHVKGKRQLVQGKRQLVQGKRQLVQACLLQPRHHLQLCVTEAMRQLLLLQPFVCCQS